MLRISSSVSRVALTGACPLIMSATPVYNSLNLSLAISKSPRLLGYGGAEMKISKLWFLIMYEQCLLVPSDGVILVNVSLSD